MLRTNFLETFRKDACITNWPVPHLVLFGIPTNAYANHVYHAARKLLRNILEGCMHCQPARSASVIILNAYANHVYTMLRITVSVFY